MHRDLKPGNVLLQVGSDELIPKIADFGLGKLLRGTTSPSQTRTGATMGTPAYMAPEQIRDSAAVDERADVFALGAILYELLTGRSAFQGADTLDTFERVAAGRYERLDDRAIPERMCVAVAQALQVDRDARLPHAGALLDAWTGQAAGVAPEPLTDPDLWGGELLEIADALAPSAAESLDSQGPGGSRPSAAPRASIAPAPTPDTFALSIDHPATTDTGSDRDEAAPEAITWSEVAKWAALAPLVALPFALGGLVATAGSFAALFGAGVFLALLFLTALAGASVLGGAAVIWRGGGVRSHMTWLVVPGLLALIGNIGTWAGASAALGGLARESIDEVARLAGLGCGTALHAELIALTLCSMLLLATADTLAGLVVAYRGRLGRPTAPRRVAAIAIALALGTLMWLATVLWLAQGAVPFVVFLILLGSSGGIALISFEEPDHDPRVGELRAMAAVSAVLGVLAAAKVVWLQQLIGLLQSVESGGGIAAADAFADGIRANGSALVLAWGAVAAVVALVALSGPGRPRPSAKKAARDIALFVLVAGPLAGSKIWADRQVAALTGEVVPAFLGAEADRILGLGLTDRGLVAHRKELPGVLDPSYHLLSEASTLLDHKREAELPDGAIVVDPGATGLRADDVVIAADGQRLSTVRDLLEQALGCDCAQIRLTVDRGGQLTEVQVPVVAHGAAAAIP